MACTSMWKFWEALGAERSEVETEYVRWMMTTSGGWRSNSGLVAKLAIVLLSTLNASWVSQRRLESWSEKQSWKVWRRHLVGLPSKSANARLRVPRRT